MSASTVAGGVVHEMPADLREALVADEAALAAWQDITPLARNEFICWVEDAKKAETRERRIRRTREELEEGCAAPAAGRAASTASGTAGSDSALADFASHVTKTSPTSVDRDPSG